MILGAGVLIEEGQARTYSPSLDRASLQVKELNLTTPSVEATLVQKPQLLKSSQGQKVKDSAIQGLVGDKKPGKKRMGLAILFLGILAEEG